MVRMIIMSFIIFFYEDCSRSGNAMKVVIVAIMIKYDNNDED